MEKICLDTDFLIDFLRNKKEAIEFIQKNESRSNLSTTNINLFELFYGAYRSKEVKRNIDAVEKIQERLNVLNLSDASVKEAGKIAAKLKESGNRIEFQDIIIGSIAKTEKYTLKTNNKKHFERINGLKLI